MSDIYLKVTILTFFNFLDLKNLSPSQFWGAPTHAVSLNFKTSYCNLKIRRLGAKRVWLFYYFNFERSYDVLKSKSPCILLNKNINFNKNETGSKNGKSPTQRETNLVLLLI